MLPRRHAKTIDPVPPPVASGLPLELRSFAYLLGIAVLRDQQGRGAGSRLLRFGLDRVDSAGSPAYLEASSPRRVPLYESHGFRVLRVLDLPKGAPVVTAMWREPGSS